MTASSLYLTFRALAALLLWAAYFSLQHHAGANEFGSFARRFTAGAAGFLNLNHFVERGCMERQAHRAHTEALGSSAQMRCVSW